MAILHKNITNSADIHNPKWHPDANNGDYAWRNEKGELESLDELLLPAALNFVDGSVAPPTSNNNDIYVLSSGGSVNGGWGSVALQDWVRYDGSVWYAITPQKSSLCYDKTADSLMSFNGTAWAAIGSGGGGGNTIYTADDTVGSGRVATITDTLTLAGGKLVLSSVNDGVLLNRVDDSQMAAISADTNEIVFNTDKEVLYRWSGSAWVALAAGFGIVGTTDATGKPTFYATVKAAYDSGGGSIKLYSNIEESTTRVLSIADGVDIDLNGYTYTYSASDGSDMFDNGSSQNMKFKISGGRLIRKNGTGTHYVFNFSLQQTQIDVINVYVENENGNSLSVKTTFNGFGSTFISNATTGDGAKFNSGSVVSGGVYTQKNNADNRFLGTELNSVDFICEGSGDNFVSNLVNSSRFFSTSGYGLTVAVSGYKIVNCYSFSSGNYAFVSLLAGEVYNSTFVSDTLCATFGSADVKIINSNFTGDSAIFVMKIPRRLQGCTITNNGNGNGLNSPNSTTGLIVSNNTINLLASTSKNAIHITATSTDAMISNNRIFVNDSTNKGINILSDAYILKNSVKGTSSGIQLNSNSNLWTTAIDSEGNTSQI